MKIPKGLQGNTARPGMGIMKEAPTPDPRDLDNLEGLELSREVDYRKPAFFKGHPENHIFDNLKTREYLDALKNDILESGAIINPLIALPDGTLIEGHSRLKVALELEAEGKTLGPLPVRFILSPMTPKEQAQRVFLGNLSRFEINLDTRLALYARIWPDYFTQDPGPGRPKKGETVSPLITREEISAYTGISERQIKNQAKIVRAATTLAQEEGKDFPEPQHIARAREEANTARKAQKGETVSPFPKKATAPQGEPPEVVIPGAGDPSTGPQDTTTRKETQEEKAGRHIAQGLEYRKVKDPEESKTRQHDFLMGAGYALDALEVYGFLKDKTKEEIKAQIHKALDDMNQGTLEI